MHSRGLQPLQYAALAALVLGPIIGATAVAQTGPAQVPVTIDRTTIVPPPNTESNGQGVVAVTFTDHATQPATRVVLDVLSPSGNPIARINDIGTFSPNVAISHRFYLMGVGQVPGKVEVDAVTLADGTVIESRPARVMPRRQQPMGYEVQMAGGGNG
jgi:hypothetical protein